MRAKRFGAFLKHLRKEKGLTMENAADALGYQKTGTIGNFENGSSTPPLEKLPLIADLYEISIDALVDELRKEVPAKAEGFDALRRYVFRHGASLPAGRGGGVAADRQSAARARYGYKPAVGADSPGVAVHPVAGVEIPRRNRRGYQTVGGAGAAGYDEARAVAGVVCGSCPFRGQLELVGRGREVAPAAAGRPPGGPPGGGDGGGSDETGKEIRRMRKRRGRVLPLVLGILALGGGVVAFPEPARAATVDLTEPSISYATFRRRRNLAA